jgi:hypothetical protein
MRSVRAVLVVLLAVVGLVLVGPATAYACSCVVSTPQDQFERADVVVEGSVVAADASTLGEGRTTHYLVEVDGVFKGDATRRLSFATASDSAACGLEGLVVGDRRVFFLEMSEDREWGFGTALSATNCGGTGQVGVQEVERIAGAPAGPPLRATPGPVRAAREAGPVRPGPGPTAWAAYVVGAGVLLLLAAPAARRRRSGGAGDDVPGE